MLVEGNALLGGEVALVTGAGAGIGAASARRLAAEGATVAVTDLDGDRAKLVAAGIVEDGGRALGLPLDVADEAEVGRCLEEAARTLGPVTILHNNAAATGLSGGGGDSDVLTMTTAVWDATMAVN